MFSRVSEEVDQLKTQNSKLKIGYVELHSHSHFSLLDGAVSPEALVEAAGRAGMSSLAITDHDGLYGIPAFFTAAKRAGVKPILGAELTLEGGHHVTLLVMDGTGYANLCRLITQAQLSGSKGSPKLAFSRLAASSAGLICLSGCSQGEIPSLLLRGKRDEALQEAEKYLSVFGAGNFYVEVQHHLHPDDGRLCRQLVDLSKALGVRVAASNNVHYGIRDDARLQDILVCIKNRVDLDHSASFRRPNSEYYLKSAFEMAALPHLPPSALEETVSIAERCNFDLDFSSYRFPDFPVPGNETALRYLKKLCLERIAPVYGECGETIMKRLEHELRLIEGKGMAGYFLIVWDIMEFARKEGILAQGRGSAASSLVAYLLGITPVDPIRHNLFVGRFLNEFAVPDIDIDIDTQRREEVIRYAYQKYGEEHAAMVCTYVTFRARNAIREVGKALGLPVHVLDRMAKSVSSYGAGHAIEDLRGIEEFKGYLTSQAWEHFCSLCTKIAHFPRHLSIHVGGMIISSKPISDMVPLERARAEGRVVCQWDKDGVDDAGLIKVDLLGLRMLSLINEAVKLVGQKRGDALDFTRMAEDDPEIYRLISRGDTVGVFQVESRAQMQSLPRVQPRSLEDLGVEVAIIRPGPLQGNMVHPYMRRRQGQEPVRYLHPLLEPVLKETLGVVLYQEQVLQVAMVIAGFSSGEANLLRKAMSRKNAAEELGKWRDRFVAGAGQRGIGEETADRIFALIGGFAEFGFCKSHAMSFAILCYRSAFLKHYYPLEFYCALLNNQPMGFYTPEVVVGDGRRHGVKALAVHVNRSLWQCLPEKGSIRLGFRYVKELGEDRVKRILGERQRGLFTSFRDFCFRARIDRESIRNLIAVGAFDEMERSRRKLLWELGTLQVLGPGGMDLETTDEVHLDEMTPWEELAADYSIQGFSPEGHLMREYREGLARIGALVSSRLEGWASGARVRIGGLSVCLQVPPTAKGFAFLTLEDEEGLMNIVLRPDIYTAFRQVVRLEPLLFVEGILEKKDGVINVMAQRVVPLS